jgi:hypothetical protein
MNPLAWFLAGFLSCAGILVGACAVLDWLARRALRRQREARAHDVALSMSVAALPRRR